MEGKYLEFVLVIKKAKGHFVIIKRSSNQEDKIILKVFKGHVPIPDILIESH